MMSESSPGEDLNYTVWNVFEQQANKREQKRKKPLQIPRHQQTIPDNPTPRRTRLLPCIVSLAHLS